MSQGIKLLTGRCLNCGTQAWVTGHEGGGDGDVQVYDWWCDSEGCKNRTPVTSEEPPSWVNKVAVKTIREPLDPKNDPPELFEVRKEVGGEEVVTKGPARNHWDGKHKRDLPKGLVCGEERLQTIIPECCATCAYKAVDSFYGISEGALTREEIYCSQHGYSFPNMWDDVFRKCGDYTVGTGVVEYCERVHIGLEPDFHKWIHLAEAGPQEGGWTKHAIRFGDAPHTQSDPEERSIYSVAPVAWLPEGVRKVGSPIFSVDADGEVLSDTESDLDTISDRVAGIGKCQIYSLGYRDGVIPTTYPTEGFEERIRRYLAMSVEMYDITYIHGLAETRKHSHVEVLVHGCEKVKPMK